MSDLAGFFSAASVCLLKMGRLRLGFRLIASASIFRHYVKTPKLLQQGRFQVLAILNKAVFLVPPTLVHLRKWAALRSSVDGWRSRQIFDLGSVSV